MLLKMAEKKCTDWAKIESLEALQPLLTDIPMWTLIQHQEGETLIFQLSRKFTAKGFLSAVDFINNAAKVAEEV